MSHIRSITLATENIDKTIDLFHNVLGMTYQKKNHTVQFGDAAINPGTRIQFVEVNQPIQPEHQHFQLIGLRTPSDEGIREYEDIFHQHRLDFQEPTFMNGHSHLAFYDSNEQRFDIFSNENNTGVGLGIPNEESTVNPLHQLQGVGPMIIKTNELMITIALLTQIFNFEVFAEYVTPQTQIRTVVLQSQNGGLGAEIHVFESEKTVILPEYGIVEQVEFTAQNISEFNDAINKLKAHQMPYENLKNDQQHTRSIRINDANGISYILTLEQQEEG